MFSQRVLTPMVHCIADQGTFHGEIVITTQEDAAHIDRLLRTREAYWIAQLCTFYPHGLNKGRESRLL